MLAAPAYTVQLQAYEGPLDLLLDLIERAELDITSISLAQVTDQYLAYLRAVPDHHLADLAAFLVIAARLLQIKSEALLPRPPVREPEEEDPGEALARQLLVYKRYKEIAGWMGARQRARLRTYLRLAAPPPAPVATTVDLRGLGPDDLRRALLAALAAEPSGPELSTVVAPLRVTIRDQIGLIVRTVQSRGQTTFRALLRRVRSRLEIIVTFLAVLELVKQRRVRAEQEQVFADIRLVPDENWSAAQDADGELEFET